MRNPLHVRLRQIGFISVLITLFILLTPVYAVLAPVTGEFQVNTTGNGTLNDFRTDIGVNTTTGDYVVAWQSDVDAFQSDVYFQRYNSAGAAQGGNTLVHAANVNDQRRPRIAVNPLNGDFVIVWESDDDASGAFNYNVYARKFNSSGTALTGEILVASAAAGDTDARVAMNSSGDFVVTWQSPDASSIGVFFQRYNSAGAPQGAITQANVTTTNPQSLPAIGIDSSGNFVIVWRDQSVGPGTPDIVMRKFNNTGAAISSEFTVGSTANLQSNPQIAMNQSTGDFVVVWHSTHAFASAQVYFQRYTSALALQGAETLVSTNTGNLNQTADVSMNTSGEFMITWARTVTAGVEVQTEGRRYSAAGASIGTEFRVDTAAGSDTDPAVALSNGEYALFAWPSALSNELYARLFADNADLAITKTSAVTGFPAYNNTNYVPGVTLTYTITVTNNGPSPVIGATVTDTLPAELAGATWTCVAAGSASCISGSPSGTGAVGAGNISQSVDVTNGGGNTLTFTLTKLIPTNQLTAISNTASVAAPSTTIDSSPANNSATVNLTAIEVADMTVTKSDAPDPVTASRDISYTITATNAGPSSASTVSLTDNIPAGTTFVSLTAPGGWSCSTPAVGATGTVTCTIAALGAGANGVFTLVVNTNPGTGGTSVSNTATVSSAASATQVDPNAANNSAIASTTVSGPTLVFTQQPTDANAGATISPAVTVELRDTTNTLISTDNTSQVALAIGANPGGGTLTGGSAVTVVNGVATFAGLSINNTGVGYTLVASSTGSPNTTSSAFNITAQPPTQLTFGTQPTNTVAGAAITPSVTVEVRDAANAIVVGDNTTQVTLAIGTNPGGGTLSGTLTQTAVNGIATFPGLSIDKVGTSYTLDATSLGLTGDTSSAFNITAAAADHLAFVQQPTSTVAGVVIAPAVTVEIRDAFDNLVTTSSATVNLTIGTNPGSGTLSGTVSLAAVNGVATFNTLSIDKAGVGYTLNAASTGLTGDTSTAFDITAAAADHLAFVQQPTNTVAGVAIAPAVTVEIRDAFDNLVNSSANVTVAIGTNPGSGTLSGTASTAAVNGVATFNTLSIDKAGVGYTLDATSTGLTGDTSSAFNITAAAADHLAFVQQPTNTVAGATITPSVTVEIRDAFDNLVNSAANVTLAIGANPGAGTLSGTLTQAAVAGVATFNDLSINNTGIGYTLTASSAGLTGDTSGTFNIIVGAPSQIAFNVQPTNTTAGASITPSVTVEVRDAFNNLVTTDNGTLITLAIGSNPGSGTLSGTATQATVNGVATFPGLSIDKAGVGYTLVASAGGYSNATSSAFNITAAAADHLAFLQQPTNTTAGAAITPAVTVQILDVFDNVVNTSANVTLAIGSNPGGGTLSGTTTQAAVAGVATFNNLSINNVGVGYTLVASSAGLSNVTSSAFNIVVGAPAQIAFNVQPTDTTAGASITPSVTVEVRDASNNLVTTDSGTLITLAIGSNPGGGTLSGTLTQPTVNGVAIFPGLSIDKAGVGYTLVAAAGGYSNVTSSAFNILAGAADHIAFLQQPTNTQAGAAITPAVTVQILDAFDNVTTSTANVTVAIGTNPGGGTLAGTTTVAAVNGVATFSNLGIDKVGVGYTLTASTAGLSSVTSSAFNISAGAAAQLAFVQQPTDATAGAAIAPAITVQVLDAFNNLVTTSSANITLAIGNNPGAGTLSGTATVAAINGIATFPGLSIDKVGTGYTLTASSAGLTGATSSAFNITVGAADHLAFLQQPTNTGVNTSIAPAITVQILDAFDNVVTTSSATVNLSILNNPGAGTLSGTTSVAAVNGVATFSNLSINNIGTGYTLSAASTGLTSATSAAFDITAAAAAQLVFVQQPTNTVAGVSIAPAVTVEVRDAFNNTVVSDNSTQVTLAIGTNPGSGTLSGTATVTVVNGVATFSNLSIDKAGTGYTFTAAAAGLTGATSTAFDITAAAASQLGFAQQPTNTAVSATITPAVTVEIRDAFNNLVSTSGTSITLAIGSNPGAGTLSGTLTQVTVNGVATFADLSIDQVGVGYTLTAAAAGLTGATSTAFNITAGAPAQIAFNVQPTTTNIGANITPAVTVEIRDALNNVVTGDNSTQITLAIGANPGSGTLGGTLTQTVVNGVATFADLNINQVGTGYTLVASSTGFSSVTSNPFDITSLPPTQLAFAQQPTNTLVNSPITPSVTVEIRNVLNAVVTTDNTTQVTIAIGSNPGVGALGGTLTQTAVNGIATFPGLTIDQLGVGYTLTVSAPGLTGATSATFDIFTVPNDTIFGVVFNDLDGNGAQDPGDVNMTGVTVFLDANNSGVLDGGEQNTLTDGSGAYSFNGLAAGGYNVRILASAGFAVTTAQPAVVTLPRRVQAPVNIGQHAVAQPTSVPPTAGPTVVIGDPIITKEVNPPFAIPGEAVGWIITVTNPGTLPATNIIVTDDVPSVVQIDTVNATAGNIGFNGQLVTFTMATLPPGLTVTISINGHVRTDVQLPFVVTNSATITNSENGSARSASAVLTGVSDLPHTGEGLPDWMRYALILAVVGVVVLVATGVVSKLNLKR